MTTAHFFFFFLGSKKNRSRLTRAREEKKMSFTAHFAGIFGTGTAGVAEQQKQGHGEV